MSSKPIRYERSGVIYRARVLSRSRKRPAGVGDDCFYWRVEAPVRKILGWRTRDDAQDALIDLARAGELLAPAPDEDDGLVQLETVDALLAAWHETIAAPDWISPRTRKPLAASSIRRYQTACEAVAGQIGGARVAELDQVAADRWLQARITGGASRGWVELLCATLGGALRWAHREGYSLTPPPRLSPPPDWTTSARRCDRRPERAEVLAVLDVLRTLHPEAWLSVRLLLATGARSGEIGALRVGDVETRSGLVLVHLGRHAGARKTGHRALPLRGSLADDVLAACEGRQASARVGASQAMTYKWLRRAIAKLPHVEPFAPKGLRYLASKRLMDAGYDIARYEAWMGHSFEVGKRWYRRIQPAELADLADALREPEAAVVEVDFRERREG
jgi:integrase